MTHPHGSLGDLQKRRDDADEWITYASWAALGTTVLAVILLVLLVISDSTELLSALLLLPGLLAQGVVGYRLRHHRSRGAGWALVSAYAYNLGVSIALFGVRGLLVKLAIGYVYLRGFVATWDYQELDAQLRQVRAGGTLPEATG